METLEKEIIRFWNGTEVRYEIIDPIFYVVYCLSVSQSTESRPYTGTERMRSKTIPVREVLSNSYRRKLAARPPNYLSSLVVNDKEGCDPVRTAATIKLQSLHTQARQITSPAMMNKTMFIPFS